MSYLPNRALMLISAALTALVLTTLAACAQPSPAPQSTPAVTVVPPTVTPLPRGGELSIRLDTDVPNLRPWQPRSRGEEQIVGMLYSGLTRLDARLQPQPDLAQEWQASSDGRLITFTLRPDMRWHDGQALTSEDVAYTIEALKAISPTTALLSDLQRVAAVTTPTSATVAISLTERYAPIFSMLTLPVLPKHLLIDKNIAGYDFWDAPVGSGPFLFDERQPRERVTLRANPHFHRGAPLLDRVTFRVISNPQAAIDALSDGRLLVAELPWPAARSLTDSDAYPENGYYFLAMNSRPGRPLSDPRVRQALAATIDLPALVDEVTDGQGIPTANSASPGSWADLTAVPTAALDLQHARRLLDEAGWKIQDGGRIRHQGGVTLTLQLYVRADDQRRVAAAEAIMRAAAQAGIEVKVQPSDFATAIRTRYAPPYDFDLLLGSWSNGAGDPAFADYAYYDPDDYALFHSSQINQGVADTRGVLNITGFSDATYDSQATAARQLYTPAERAKAIELAQKRVAELKPYLFLWVDRIPVALGAQVDTLDGPVDLTTPMYFWNIERWFLRS